MLYSDTALLWKSKKHKSVSTSTTDAEYLAACEATREVCWLLNLFNGLKFKISLPVSLFGDNMNANNLANAVSTNSRTRHIKLQKRFVTEKVAEAIITVVWMPTCDEVVDIFMKALRISKNPGLRYDLVELTPADDLTLHCNACPALCGIFQYSSIHNAISQSTPSLCYRTQHAPLPTLLLLHLRCHIPSLHMFFLNACTYTSPFPTSLPLACLWQHLASRTTVYNSVALVMALPMLCLPLSRSQSPTSCHDFANA